MSTPTTIVSVGGGNMARAIIEGAVASKRFPPSAFVVIDPNTEKLDHFRSIGCAAHEHVATLPVVSENAAIMLAIKPQMLSDAAPSFASLCGARRLVISILAGVQSPTIRVMLRRGGAESVGNVIRVMPNTPAAIGAGCTAYACSGSTLPEEIALVESLFESVGPIVERLDEPMMDAFTALAGSGPAYLFYLVEAMANAGVELGFERAQAERFARQTVIGSSRLLAQSDESAAELRARVTSKKGTTQAATDSLDASHVMVAFARALTAARDRGRSLASEFDRA
ncbi:MAG: pyrroline-5-carboxylate reductase [Planctomycetota bacterium]